jgi:hypothetical protein
MPANVSLRLRSTMLKSDDDAFWKTAAHKQYADCDLLQRLPGK